MPFKFVLCWFLFLVSADLFAASADPVAPELLASPDIADAPLLAPRLESAEPLRKQSLLGTLHDSNLLLLGLRLDTAYNAGATPAQGFSIPSVRLTVWGDVGKFASYRLSLGQTREFSSVLLPQIVPVEAFVDLNSSSEVETSSSPRIRFRTGLFTPTFNPWWTPDLSSLAIPDYGEMHRSFLVGRDMGAELLFDPFRERLSFFAGYFNGTGILGFNTNNAKAFTAGVRTAFELGGGTLQFGLSAMARLQADPSSVNFRSDLVGNFYLCFDHPDSGFQLGAELLSAELNDSVRTAYPFGGAVILQLPVFEGVRLFTRGEVLKGSGTGNGLIRNAQVGPVLDLHKALQAYVFYQYLENGGSPENIGWVRLRLVL